MHPKMRNRKNMEQWDRIEQLLNDVLPLLIKIDKQTKPKRKPRTKPVEVDFDTEELAEVK